MNIRRRLATFDQNYLKKRVFSLFFVCSLSASSIINYACTNFRATCTNVLQHGLELSTLHSIPSNGHVGGLC